MACLLFADTVERFPDFFSRPAHSAASPAVRAKRAGCFQDLRRPAGGPPSRPLEAHPRRQDLCSRPSVPPRAQRAKATRKEPAGARPHAPRQRRTAPGATRRARRPPPGHARGARSQAPTPPQPRIGTSGRFLSESSSVTRRSGRAIASGSPGKPAPLPTSIRVIPRVKSPSMPSGASESA